MNIRALALSTSTLSLFALGSMPAVAEDEIIVTAQKKEATLQETPVAVSVISADDISKAQIRDLEDMQFIVPSLDVTTRSAPGTIGYNLRGFGTSSDNFALEPSVSVFVDGVYKARQAASLSDFIDIERVEVLRGPQATLYGRNAVAGAVAYTTKKPDLETFGGALEATLGSYEQNILKGTVTGPISDALGFRVSGFINTRDGFLENIATGTTVNDRDRKALRGQLLWEMSDQSEIRFIAEHTELNEDCCAAPFSVMTDVNAGLLVSVGGTILDADPFNYKIAVDGDVNTTLKTNTYSLQYDRDLGSATLVSITAFDDFAEKRNIDADFTDVTLNPIRENIQEYQAWSQEVRLFGSQENLDWLVGFNYYDQEMFSGETRTLGALMRPLVDGLSGNIVTALESNPLVNNAVSNPDGLPYLQGGNGYNNENYSVDTQAWALYGQLDYHVSERLKLTAGLRVGKEEKEVVADVDVNEPFSDLNFVTLGAALFGLTAEQAVDPSVNGLLALQSYQFFPRATGVFSQTSLEDDVAAYNLIAAYDATDGVNIYASYSTGYKPSGFNLAPSAEAAGNTEFGNEDATSIELGFKGKFLEGDLTSNIAIFQTVVEDFQTNSFDGTGFSIQTAGELEVAGFEIDGVLSVGDNLSVAYAWTHLADAQYNDNKLGSCPLSGAAAGVVTLSESCVLAGVQDVSGNRLSEASKNQASLSATYFMMLDDYPAFVRADGYYRSDFLTSDDTDPRKVQDDYALLNLSAGISSVDEKYTLQLFVKNVLEEQYYIGDFNSIGLAGNLNSFPSAPRTYGVTLRANF